jgi:hypothetical protein
MKSLQYLIIFGFILLFADSSKESTFLHWQFVPIVTGTGFLMILVVELIVMILIFSLILML